VDIDALQLPEKGDCVDWLALNPHATQKIVAELALIDAPVLENKKTENKNSDEDDCLTENTSSQRDKPQPSFITNERGVFYLDEKGMFRVCSKLEITALVRDKASENWGRLLEITDADGHIHPWAMPMEMLKGGGDELRGELLRLGLEISPGLRIRNLLIEYITLTKPETRARCVTRTGWYGDVFVLPNQTIGDTDEKVIYQSENPLRDYQQSGTLQAWQKSIALPSHGNSRLMFSISCAFASTLLHPAGSESGGIHFVGESSPGKTTALRVAASVFGAPDYLNRWRATTNGLEALASLRSDTLLILDELAQVDSKEAGEIAYMLANGSGKTRAGRTGNARSRHEWRLLFLSAGEVGLSQHMRDAGKKIKAGQAVRLVDIPADAGKGLGIFETLHKCESGAQLSQVLIEAASYFYGTPSIAFLNAITKPETLSKLPALIKQNCNNFLDDNLPPNASGQVHRVCERFALIGTGGEIASMLSITGWSIHEAMKAASICFQAWLEHRGGAGNHERTAVLAHVQAFFEAHGTSRFEDMQTVHPQHINNRVGFKRQTSNGENEYFVLPEMFRQEMCNGFETRFVAQVLIEAGMLNKSPEGKAQTAHRLPGEGLRKCYHFVRTEADCENSKPG
jgi:putative DNA primase/helicase